MFMVLGISKLTATYMFPDKGNCFASMAACTAVYNSWVETARRRRQQSARQKLFAGEVEIMWELMGNSSEAKVSDSGHKLPAEN